MKITDQTLEWLKLILSICAALGAAWWAVHTWKLAQAEDRERERDRLAALYVTPFILASEQLQSRVFNILDHDGLVALRRNYPDDGAAADTLFLIAQYFGWERVVYRYGPYTHDKELIRLTQVIRASFATDRIPCGAFCFFRTEQQAIGEMVMQRSPGEKGAEFEAMGFYKFKAALDDASGPLAKSVSVKRTLDAISHHAAESHAGTSEKLEGRERLALLQNGLVDVLEYIESKEQFSVSPGKRKRVGLVGLAKTVSERLKDGNSLDAP